MDNYNIFSDNARQRNLTDDQPPLVQRASSVSSSASSAADSGYPQSLTTVDEQLLLNESGRSNTILSATTTTATSASSEYSNNRLIESTQHLTIGQEKAPFVPIATLAALLSPSTPQPTRSDTRNNRLSIDALINHDDTDTTPASNNNFGSSSLQSGPRPDQPAPYYQSFGHTYVTGPPPIPPTSGKLVPSDEKKFLFPTMKDTRLYDGEHKPLPLTLLEPYIYNQLGSAGDSSSTTSLQRDSGHGSLTNNELSGAVAFAKSSIVLNPYMNDYSLENILFRMEIIQQPGIAKACGWSDKDRKFLDPPPILRLSIADRYDRQSDDDLPPLDLVPFLLMCVSLWDEDKSKEFTHVSRVTHDGSVDYKSSIAGQTMTSGYAIKDIGGKMGLFYFFPDISLRQEGRFRLMFKLFSVATHFLPGVSQSEEGKHVHATVFSEPFEVFSTKDYQGYKESTDITKHFAAHGIRLPLRRTNAQT